MSSPPRPAATRPDGERRFTREAAAALRAAIREAGGDEVFAVGALDDRGRVASIEIHARGHASAVNAPARARAGEVVIHNHPSGDLRPSDPDLALAGRFGDEGVGFIIVNNAVSAERWVVEPAKRRPVPVDEDALREVFEVALPRAMGRQHEARGQQLEMALSVARLLNDGGVLMAEAGTGTGKSLAYLVPSILWAQANDSKVVISTYTRTLQGQLMTEDLPMARRAGLSFEAALLKGRSNYLCRRKLQDALNDPFGDLAWLERLERFAARAEEGSLQDLGEAVPEEVWERVESDSDHTLRVRCPHYNQCFFYGSRRRAASAHLLVVNHALLLADLSVKAKSDGDGLLPRFGRVIFDEAHHLEDAATSATAGLFSALSVSRAVAPLLRRRGDRPGSLERLRERLVQQEPSLDARTRDAERELAALREAVAPALDTSADAILDGDPARRVTPAVEDTPRWRVEAEPRLSRLAEQLRRARGRLESLQEQCANLEIPPEHAQPVLDLRRAVRRLGDLNDQLRLFLEHDEARCRWVERSERRMEVRLRQAPVEVGELLQSVLFSVIEGVGLTSATLTVAGRFEHARGRLGLGEDTVVVSFPSPFSYREQAILGLPRDLPHPDAPEWFDRVAEVTVDLLRASGGGAFVLCTSYALLTALGDHVEAEIGDAHPVLIQGRRDRWQLLSRFQESEASVLFGADSFWEGVSVRGRALRLVIIPRLPFRVPTEPIAQARYELIASRGLDPFRAYALPEAILKLRQGFGRLVRSRSDTGAVVILDRRVHEMWYGRLFLSSLPDARRVVGPARAVVEAVAAGARGEGDERGLAPGGEGAQSEGRRSPDDVRQRGS